MDGRTADGRTADGRTGRSDNNAISTQVEVVVEVRVELGNE